MVLAVTPLVGDHFLYKYFPSKQVWNFLTKYTVVLCPASILPSSSIFLLMFQCSRSCDNGVQTRKSYCTEGDSVVDDSFCDKRRKPENAKVCSLRPCKASWFIGEWSKVNITIAFQDYMFYILMILSFFD